MRLTALAGFFAFVTIVTSVAPHAQAQSLDVSKTEDSNYLIAFSQDSLMVNKKSQKKSKKPVVYTVKDGDTLISIAKKYKTTWQRLYDKNTKLKDADIINPGDKVVIPSKKEKLKHRPLTAGSNNAGKTAYKYSTASASSPAVSYTPASSDGNRYTYGYCTWYAKNRRPDLPNNLGNADTWVMRAAAEGFATGSTPRVGAVGQQGMHVVYVERVNSDGTVTISEMNYTGYGQVNNRTVPAGTFQYIY